MKIIIQKFGGTSVSTKERRSMAAEKVLAAQKQGYSPVVVVSAMGRKGEPYATDTLLSLIDANFKNTNLIASDLLMSCGEVISTVVMSDELNNNNLECIPLLGGQAGIITDENFSKADVLRIDTDRLLDLLKGNKIPIVAGFQGISEKGFITTLGRGGSDTTAALLGAAVKAEKIEIYTDVDGIMTADPRIVKNASLIEKISYNEVFQFAEQGAKVIHPRAVEIAAKANIPLVIKNTLNNCDGTIINNTGSSDCTNIITGITHMSNRTQISILLSNNANNDEYHNIFSILANNNISIDLINVFPKENIFTIDADKKDKFDFIMKNLNLIYTSEDNCSKISLIGSGMRGVPGVMARILKALAKEKIEVLQTADSHTTIWCLVKSKFTIAAINALHNEFNL